MWEIRMERAASRPAARRRPGGRPKGAQQIQNKALSLCSEALDVLTQIMRGQADWAIASSQLQAAQAILDRGVGKAGQSLALQIDIKKRLSELSREELIALRAQYVAAPYRAGRSPHWLKVKNPDAPAVRRLEEEDWNG
jgi:hypothetical protein